MSDEPERDEHRQIGDAESTTDKARQVIAENEELLKRLRADREARHRTTQELREKVNDVESREKKAGGAK